MRQQKCAFRVYFYLGLFVALNLLSLSLSYYIENCIEFREQCNWKTTNMKVINNTLGTRQSETDYTLYLSLSKCPEQWTRLAKHEKLKRRK